MFVNEDYANYKYLVSVSDNYVVLTNRHSVNADWQRPVTIDIIYQYFDPSYITIESERNITSQIVYSEVDISSDFWDRPDCPKLIVAIFCVSILLIKIVNSITEFVQKGGLFNE